MAKKLNTDHLPSIFNKVNSKISDAISDKVTKTQLDNALNNINGESIEDFTITKNKLNKEVLVGLLDEQEKITIGNFVLFHVYKDSDNTELFNYITEHGKNNVLLYIHNKNKAELNSYSLSQLCSVDIIYANGEDSSTITELRTNNFIAKSEGNRVAHWYIHKNSAVINHFLLSPLTLPIIPNSKLEDNSITYNKIDNSYNLPYIFNIETDNNEDLMSGNIEACTKIKELIEQDSNNINRIYLRLFNNKTEDYPYGKLCLIESIDDNYIYTTPIITKRTTGDDTTPIIVISYTIDIYEGTTMSMENIISTHNIPELESSNIPKNIISEDKLSEELRTKINSNNSSDSPKYKYFTLDSNNSNTTEIINYCKANPNDLDKVIIKYINEDDATSSLGYTISEIFIKIFRLMSVGSTTIIHTYPFFTNKGIYYLTITNNTYTETLFKIGETNISDNAISNVNIQNNSIYDKHIVNGNITFDKLADDVKEKLNSVSSSSSSDEIHVNCYPDAEDSTTDYGNTTITVTSRNIRTDLASGGFTNSYVEIADDWWPTIDNCGTKKIIIHCKGIEPIILYPQTLNMLGGDDIGRYDSYGKSCVIVKSVYNSYGQKQYELNIYIKLGYDNNSEVNIIATYKLLSLN